MTAADNNRNSHEIERRYLQDGSQVLPKRDFFKNSGQSIEGLPFLYPYEINGTRSE